MRSRHWREARTRKGTPVRTIKKRRAPNALVEWRARRLAKNRPEGMECTYEEMRKEPAVREAVEEGLFQEQGGLCAYTGTGLAMRARTEGVNFHIEHLIPQTHCDPGEDTAYDNLVACWPRPNCGFEPTYGARKKGTGHHRRRSTCSFHPRIAAVPHAFPSTGAAKYPRRQATRPLRQPSRSWAFRSPRSQLCGPTRSGGSWP